MTYGTTAGGTVDVFLSGVTPDSTTYILADTGLDLNNNTFLQTNFGTGDSQDTLSITGGPTFAAILSGTSTPSGTFPLNGLSLPGTLPHGFEVFWQGFTQHPTPGVDFFQDFSNYRRQVIHDGVQWQDTATLPSVAVANLAWAVKETGLNGRATKVFVCGGGPALLTEDTVPYPTSVTTWEYDVATEEHRAMDDMLESRAFHTVTRLNDGRLLVCGGVTGPFGGPPPAQYFTKVLNSAEIWQEGVGFSSVGPMNGYRAGHTATLIESGPNAGMVLIAGGVEGDVNHELFGVDEILSTGVNSTELFDPATGNFIAGPNLPEPKAGARALWLQNDTLAVIGGVTWRQIGPFKLPDFSDMATFLDPNTMVFGNTRNLLAKRALFGMVELPNGNLVLAGGAGGDILNIGPIADAELFALAGQQFISLPPMPGAVAFNGIAATPTSQVVVAGGAGGTIFDPVPVKSVYQLDALGTAWTTLADLPVEQGGGVTELLEDGNLLVSCGETGVADTATNSTVKLPVQ